MADVTSHLNPVHKEKLQTFLSYFAGQRDRNLNEIQRTVQETKEMRYCA